MNVVKTLGLLAASLVACSLQADVEPIFRLTPDYRYSWKAPKPGVESRTDYLKLTADPAKAVQWKRDLAFRTDNFFPYYVASEKAVVRFSYRSDVAATLNVKINALLPYEKELPARRSFPIVSVKLPASKDWCEISREFEVPRQELDESYLTFDLARGTGVFEVKDMRIDEAEPARKDGAPLLLEGKPATEICVIKSDDPIRHRHEMKAALMLRYALYFTGGEYLPVKAVASADEAVANAVVIGGEAMRPGKGGYEMKLKDGRLTLKGAIPCGPQFGAFRLMEKLGIRYLGGDFWAKGGDRSLAAFDTVETPDIAERTIQANRCGMMCELKGFLGDLETTINCGPASYSRNGELLFHSVGQILPLAELEKTHPEYFAMKKDGTRITSKEVTWENVKYCYTNPGFLDEFVKRYGEILDSQPATFMVDTLAGDGGANICQCPECKKYPTVSDLTFTFYNRVAQRLAKTHPHVDVNFWSYVDNPEPPKGPVEPRSENLKLRYAVYPPDYWDSGLIWDNSANDEGHKALAAWRRLVPDAAPGLYYGSCEEGFLAFQPHFDFQVEAIRDFARHHAIASQYLGLHGVHRNGSINSGGMIDLVQYIVARVSMHADYDVEAGLDEYFRDLYGAAEEPMRAFFDRTRGEYRRRNWVTNCEVEKRGFFTEEFATTCLGHLDAALEAAKENEKLTFYILRDKQVFLYSYFRDISRGRGNVPRALFETWAKRLADFCRIARRLDAGYMNTDKATKRFFHDCALYDITLPSNGAWSWWKAPEIDKLIADPVKALGADFPNRAKAVEGGWEIPADGMIGGQFFAKSRWMSKVPTDMRNVRRESSGFGVLQTAFDLADGVPAGGMTMEVLGLRSEKKDDWPLMSVEVNGKVVFNGKALWPGDRYEVLTFEVPADCLVKGRNEIVLKNLTPDPEAALDGLGGAKFRVKRDYNRGWFAVRSITMRKK